MENKMINYFNQLHPLWNTSIMELESLLIKLIKNDNIEEIKFIFKNLQNLGLSFVNDVEMVLNILAQHYSHVVGLENKVNLLNTGIPINYELLIKGAAEGNHYNLFKYAIQNIKPYELDFLEELLEIAAYHASIDVLDEIINIAEKENFDFDYYNLLFHAAFNNKTNVLKYLVEKGLVTLDEMRLLSQKQNFKNLANFLNSYSVLGKRKREEVEYPVSKRLKY